MRAQRRDCTKTLAVLEQDPFHPSLAPHPPIVSPLAISVPA